MVQVLVVQVLVQVEVMESLPSSTRRWTCRDGAGGGDGVVVIVVVVDMSNMNMSRRQ